MGTCLIKGLIRDNELRSEFCGQDVPRVVGGVRLDVAEVNAKDGGNDGAQSNVSIISWRVCFNS